MTGTKIPVHIRPWRSWITQRIPIPENRGSNPFGRAKIIWGTLWSAPNNFCPLSIRRDWNRAEKPKVAAHAAVSETAASAEGAYCGRAGNAVPAQRIEKNE